VAIGLARLVLRKGSYATITGKAFRPRPLRLGARAWPMVTVCWAYLTFAVFLPMAALLMTSFQKFATVIVGDDPASVTYVRMKENRSRKVGMESRHVGLPGETTTAELVAVISGLSADPAVHGILLQHPVPAHIDERAAFEAIDPAKDVDGVTMKSFAAMAFGYPAFASATPGAIMRANRVVADTCSLGGAPMPNRRASSAIGSFAPSVGRIS